MTMQHAELPSRQPKLMILYASYGEGHRQAALAVKESLSRRGNDRTVMIDLMAEAHPLLNGMTRLAYRSSYTVMPGLYGWLYDRTRPMKPDSILAAWLQSFGRAKLHRMLLQERPDALLHTFPLYANLGLRPSLLPGRLLTAAVVTDYDLHCRWVHPGIDRYYVPTSDFGRQLTGLGIASSRICVSGIPVKKGFRMSQTPLHKIKLFARYGLNPDLPLVLIMGGGSMNGILHACSRLLGMSQLQVALVCGRNEALRAAAARRLSSHPGRTRLHLFGYVESMPELMPLASCLVTKPGGLTLAEGLAAGVPLLVYRPVPGQEHGNAAYLASKGAAEIITSPAKLAEEIMKLFSSPERLTERRAASFSLGLPGGADAIAEDLLRRLSGYTH